MIDPQIQKEQEAMLDFVQNPEAYATIASQNGVDLPKEFIGQIKTLASKDPKKAAEVILQEKKLKDVRGLISQIYASKKGKKYAEGGKLAYLRCLKQGGTADCNCKSKKAAFMQPGGKTTSTFAYTVPDEIMDDTNAKRTVNMYTSPNGNVKYEVIHSYNGTDTGTDSYVNPGYKPGVIRSILEKYVGLKPKQQAPSWLIEEATKRKANPQNGDYLRELTKVGR